MQDQVAASPPDADLKSIPKVDGERDLASDDGVLVSRCASEPPQPPELIKNIIYFEHHPQTACVGGRAGGTWRIFCV